jgi:UDP-3-O-[3-hydroxymyristoyl] N-acetylglucosamine deacetylase
LKKFYSQVFCYLIEWVANYFVLHTFVVCKKILAKKSKNLPKSDANSFYFLNNVISRASPMHSISQKTINNEISCSGIGIHSAIKATILLRPADVDTGIIFIRTDIIDRENKIPANYKNVVEASYGTVIQNSFGARVATIEHIMSAIFASEIDNLFVEINAPEVPIMDGSAEPFIFLLECAGTLIQNAPRKIIEIVKNIRIDEKDKFIEVFPAKNFSVDFHIDFNHKAIQHKDFSYNSDINSFKNEISRARTFGFKNEIDLLKKNGLALGGSLENAVLVDENAVVNEEGLRYKDEFVRHKILDFVGDIYLAQSRIIAHFIAHKAGHNLNNKILHKIFDNVDCFKIV